MIAPSGWPHRQLACHPFTWIALPHHYTDLFQSYMIPTPPTCQKCMNRVLKPALCLVCGSLVTLEQSYCCGWAKRHRTPMTAAVHVQECGEGCGVFLVLASSTIRVIRRNRISDLNSPYVDQHGQEGTLFFNFSLSAFLLTLPTDKDLKRGAPLHLSSDRFAELIRLHTTCSFDHSTAVLRRTKLWHV